MVNYDYKDKVIIITGAGGALGSTVTKKFYEAGSNVVMVDIEEDLLQAVANQFQETNRILVQTRDLTKDHEVKEMVDVVLEKFSKIDFVANIAGGFVMGDKTHETDLNTLLDMFDINVKTGYNVNRHVLKHMVHQNYGKIVNIGARAALEGKANMGPYCGSKSMVIKLTESMAKEYRDVNINCILPGTIDTERNRKDMPNADFSKWVNPEDIADVILFLCSEGASAIKGGAIPVYGHTL